VHAAPKASGRRSSRSSDEYAFNIVD